MNQTTTNQTKRKQTLIAREGYPFIFFLLGHGIFLLLLRWYRGGGLFLLISALMFFLTCGFVTYFFRDPKRVIPTTPGAVVSPADGKIINISQTKVPGFNEPYVKVSIFLSVFNVHINRVPIAGKVEAIDYTPGKFKAAFVDKASSDNEHNTILVAGEQAKIIVKQIAGLIARRIVCWIKPGEQVAKGERFGLIRFGSRTELFMPATITQLKVNKGDVVKGGETIIALLQKPETSAKG
jgi:phosphatidylserine decarboxylase